MKTLTVKRKHFVQNNVKFIAGSGQLRKYAEKFTEFTSKGNLILG